MKNSIKSLFVTALMLPAFGVFSSAFAYEMVEAETVFPKAKDNQNAPQLSAGVEKKEFTIPNPLDELTLRRIREAEKANLAVQPAEKKSDISIDSKKLEYYDETGDYSFTTNYNDIDYINFLNGTDSQVNHEGKEVIQKQLKLSQYNR